MFLLNVDEFGQSGQQKGERVGLLAVDKRISCALAPGADFPQTGPAHCFELSTSQHSQSPQNFQCHCYSQQVVRGHGRTHILRFTTDAIKELYT